MHGELAGTDATNPVYQAVAWLLVLAAVSAGVIRVVMGRNAARTKEGRGTPRRVAADTPTTDVSDPSLA